MELTAGTLEGAKGSGAPRPRRSTLLVLAGCFAATMACVRLVSAVAPGELVRPVAPDLLAAAVFAGVLAGLLLAIRIVTHRSVRPDRPGGRLDALAGALVLPTLVATAFLRLGVQAVCFVGLGPLPATPVPFTVTGTRVRHGRCQLRVRSGAAGREFGVPVGSAACDAAHDGDRVTLPVETGRFGVQRAMVGSAATYRARQPDP